MRFNKYKNINMIYLRWTALIKVVIPWIGIVTGIIVRAVVEQILRGVERGVGRGVERGVEHRLVEGHHAAVVPSLVFHRPFTVFPFYLLSCLEQTAVEFGNVEVAEVPAESDRASLIKVVTSDDNYSQREQCRSFAEMHFN